MNVRDLAAQHDVLAKRFKLYEQRVGQLPPVEVLNELRYALRAAIRVHRPEGHSEPKRRA